MSGRVDDKIGPELSMKSVLKWGDQQTGTFRSVFDLYDQYHTLTMYDGTFVNNDSFWEWYNQNKKNSIKEQKVTIECLVNNDLTTKVWTFVNALITDISGAVISPDNREVNIQHIRIDFESYSLS